MQVPKFKEFITETDIKRRDKPMTIAIVTVADSKDPKENTTAELLTKICKKKEAIWWQVAITSQIEEFRVCKRVLWL